MRFKRYYPLQKIGHAVNSEYNILVIDDSGENRDGVCGLLKVDGYSVESACDGVDALGKLETFAPHLFIIDVAMPNMNGIELLKKLKVKENAWEAIIMTGHESLEDAKKAMALGALSYIGKPIQYTDLRQHVDNALAEIRQNDLMRKYQAELEFQVKQQTGELEEALHIVKNQNERFDTIIMSMENGLLALDMNDNIMMANRAFEKISNKPFFKIIGCDFKTALENDGLVLQLVQALGELGDDRKTEQTIEIFDSLSGDRKSFQVRVSFLRDRDEVVGKVIVFNDETEKIKAIRMQKSFLNNMSHEMRTPLTAIVSMIEALRNTHPDSEQAGYINILASSQTALLALVERILDFSHLAQHSIDLHPVMFSLEQMCRKVAGPFEQKAGDKGVGFKFCFASPQGAEAIVMSDEGRIRSVLNNLLNNAVKFTHDGKITFSTRVHPVAESMLSCEFAVSDTGIGIDPDKFDIIFKEFTQLEDSPNRRYCGAGLGLAVSRGIAQCMHGDITVQSRPGVGSTFIFGVDLPTA
ncbi:MAG: response regulator [Chitinivibrionales bacterium]|nr:response regulator [Chitinivibrionales bacterium]